MNKVEVYYFSGTGNSLIVARDITKKLNAKIINVLSIINQENINSDANVLGFVFPIYHFKHPFLIEKIVTKFRNFNSKYIFAVCTYGLKPSNSIKIFDNLIKSCGGKLSGGFTVKMPHNGIGSNLFTQREHEIMFNNWKTKLGVIVEYIIKRKKGKLETSNMIINLISSGLFVKTIPTVIKLMKQVIMKGWKSLLFASNEKCDGCGICKKICPVNNIEIINNKPSWLNLNCIGCFACLHWCPKDAIQLGRTNIKIKNYHHPDVKISDILVNK